VARRGLPAGCSRGGEEIQAPRPRSARLATAVASLAAAAGFAAGGAFRESGDFELLLLALGAGGLLWLCLGLLTRWSAALATGFAFLGAEQAVRLTLGPGTVDTWTPAYAACLLFSAELAWWSVEPRVAAWWEPGVVLWRLATIVGLCAAGAVVAALVVLAAGSPLHGGLGLELVGVIAAFACIAVVAGLARVRVG
jgi:hypothetical protein